MKSPLFTGTCTALVTPFLDGKVNYPMMEQLLRRQIDAGIEAIVLCGTTGEAATLTDDEKVEMVRRAKQYVGDSCLIIAGTGSNSTAHAVSLSLEAQDAGADALLVVSPYYNKATDDGLVAHYMSVAHAVTIPVIIYNVPGRTGQDIPVRVYKRLSAVPNIAGIKEAATSIDKICAIRYQCPNLPIWSGNDAFTVPIMALGGLGVISVISNVFPEEMSAITSAALCGDVLKAGQLQRGLQPYLEVIFSQINPVPVKAAMKAMGYDCGGCRLPLTDADDICKSKIKALFS